MDASQARARGILGRIKEKVAQVRQLGDAAVYVDLEQLAERGLGMLLDDVLGPAKEQTPAPRVAEGPTVRVIAAPPPPSPTSPRRTIVKPWHVPSAEAPRGGDPK